MLHRPLAIWILALVVFLAGLVSLVIMLQFLDVLPDTGEPIEFFGGKWAGVVLYGLVAAVLIAAAAGWLLLKPWAPMFTLLFALFGFFVPFMSVLAGNSIMSAAAAPMILSVLIVLLATRPPVRQALAEGAAADTAPKPPKAKRGKTPAPPRPKGFRSDDV